MLRFLKPRLSAVHYSVEFFGLILLNFCKKLIYPLLITNICYSNIERVLILFNYMSKVQFKASNALYLLLQATEIYTFLHFDFSYRI